MAGRTRPVGELFDAACDGDRAALARLLSLTAQLGGTLVDPLKTTVVQQQRCMTTWVVRKESGAPAAIRTRDL